MGIKEKEKTCRGQCGKQCAKAKQVRHASSDSHSFSTTDSSDGPKEITHKKDDQNMLSSQMIEIFTNHRHPNYKHNNYGERGERER